MDDKKNFFKALLKTKYGKNIKKKAKQKEKKIPLSLKALGAAAFAASKKGDLDMDIKKNLYKGKNSELILKGNPKKKSIGIFFKKSF